MAQKFNSNREAKKWDSIEKAATVSFNRMLEGKATTTDFRATSKILEQQSKLAKNVFDEGVRSIELTADDIVDKLNKKRIDFGKKPLTQKAQNRIHKQTMSDVMKNYAPDIIGSLKDIITEQLEDNQKEINDTITKGFDKLDGYAPTRLIQPKDTGVEDSIDQNTRKLDDVEDDVDSSLQKLIKQSKKEHDDVASGYSPSAVAKANADEKQDDGTTIGPDGSVVPVVSLTPKTEAEVVEATQEQSKLRTMIQNMFGRDDTSDDDEKEEKKASAWMRKFGSFFKQKSKALMPNNPLKTILKALAVALTAPELFTSIAKMAKEYLTIDNIQSLMSKTWDTLYSTGQDIISWVMDKLGIAKPREGSDPVKNTVDERVDARIAEYKEKLKAAQDAKNKAGGDISKISAQQRIDLDYMPKAIGDLEKMKKDRAPKGKAAGANATTPSSGKSPIPVPVTNPTTGSVAPTKADTTTPAPTGSANTDVSKNSPVAVATSAAGTPKALNPDGTIAMTTPDGKTVSQDSSTAISTSDRSSVVSNPSQNTKSPTTTNSEKVPTTANPVVIPDPAYTNTAADPKRQNNNSAMSSTNSITMASFGMNAGSDQLQLLNLGAIA